MDAFTVLLPVADVEFSVLVLIVVGFSVGVLGGFFGVGGGWIATPALNIFGLPMAFAIGTGLANITGQSIIAGFKHRKMGNVDYALGTVTGVFMIFGLEAGAQALMWLERTGMAESAIRCAYILMLGALGAYMLRDFLANHPSPRAGGGSAATAGAKRDAPPVAAIRWRIPPMVCLGAARTRVSLWLLAAIGLIAGALAGAMGVGGGFLLVPAFIYLVGVPTALAVGTSLVCVMVSGAYGTFTYGLKGRVDIVAAVWMLVGAAIGAQIGVAAVRYVRGYQIRLLYSLMLPAAALSILMMQMGWGRVASVTILGVALLMCLTIIASMVTGLKASRAAQDSAGKSP